MQQYKKLGISNRFLGCSFENYIAITPEQKTALKNAQSYAENFESNLKTGRSLVLIGSTGTGKTHLATAVLKYIFDKHQEKQQWFGGFSHNATDYVEDFCLKPVADRKEMLETLGIIKLWHLDDLGRGSLTTAGVQNAWCRIFDARYKNQDVDSGMLPVIITTNYDPAGIRSHIGDAAYDRLRENANVVAMAWESYREQIQNKFEAMHNKTLN